MAQRSFAPHTQWPRVRINVAEIINWSAILRMWKQRNIFINVQLIEPIQYKQMERRYNKKKLGPSVLCLTLIPPRWTSSSTFVAQRWDMWLSVTASVLAIGFVLAVIHRIYSKVNHWSLIRADNRRASNFVHDAFASLIQSEPPPNFRNNKCTCSAGFVACIINF